MKHIPMTVYGAKKLQEELFYLKNIRRPKIIQEIADARKHGDLKENAEYQSAREQQSFCEGRIKKIESTLFNSQIIDISNIFPSSRVIFGSKLNIENMDNNEKYIYRIVGDDEADFKKNLVSINSPIARGLIGKKEGDVVVITTPGGKVTYKILKVEYLS